MDCPHEAEIKMLGQRDQDIISYMQRMEIKLNEVAAGISAIKVIENENRNLKEAIDRAFREIASLKTELALLNSIKDMGKGAMWATRILWAVGGAIGTLAIFQLKYLLYMIGHAQ